MHLKLIKTIKSMSKVFFKNIHNNLVKKKKKKQRITQN